MKSNVAVRSSNFRPRMYSIWCGRLNLINKVLKKGLQEANILYSSVCLHLLGIFAGQGNIRDVCLTSEFSKCRPRVFLKIIPPEAELLRYVHHSTNILPGSPLSCFWALRACLTWSFMHLALALAESGLPYLIFVISFLQAGFLNWNF